MLASSGFGEEGGALQAIRRAAQRRSVGQRSANIGAGGDDDVGTVVEQPGVADYCRRLPNSVNAVAAPSALMASTTSR